jgi:hypothetical protein
MPRSRTTQLDSLSASERHVTRLAAGPSAGVSRGERLGASGPLLAEEREHVVDRFDVKLGDRDARLLRAATCSTSATGPTSWAR